jgi:hypothetical protein
MRAFGSATVIGFSDSGAGDVRAIPRCTWMACATGDVAPTRSTANTRSRLMRMPSAGSWASVPRRTSPTGSPVGPPLLSLK